MPSIHAPTGSVSHASRSRPRGRPAELALVGVGYWGSRILDSLVATDRAARLAWVCDRDGDRLRAAAPLAPGARQATALAEVLEDPGVDAVLLAVPPSEHVSLGLRVLESGRDLFVEKPMALEVSGAERLVAAAEAHRAHLMVGLTYLYNPGIERVADLVALGTLGRVRYLHSQRTNRKDGGKHTSVLWSLAPHDVSILMHVLGAGPTSLRARQIGAPSASGADEAELDLGFPGDVRARVLLSWRSEPKVRRLIVVGERRTAVFDEAQGRPRVRLVATPPAIRGGDDESAFAALLDAPDGPGEPLELDAPERAPLGIECDHFLDCVRSRRAPRTDGRLGLDVTRVLATLQRSMDADGRPYELDVVGSRSATAG